MMENLEGGGNYSTFLFYLHVVTAKTSSANSFTPLERGDPIQLPVIKEMILISLPTNENEQNNKRLLVSSQQWSSNVKNHSEVSQQW